MTLAVSMCEPQFGNFRVYSDYVKTIRLLGKGTDLWLREISIYVPLCHSWELSDAIASGRYQKSSQSNSQWAANHLLLLKAMYAKHKNWLLQVECLKEGFRRHIAVYQSLNLFKEWCFFHLLFGAKLPLKHRSDASSETRTKAKERYDASDSIWRLRTAHQSEDEESNRKNGSHQRLLRNTGVKLWRHWPSRSCQILTQGRNLMNCPVLTSEWEL